MLSVHNQYMKGMENRKHYKKNEKSMEHREINYDIKSSENIFKMEIGLLDINCALTLSFGTFFFLSSDRIISYSTSKFAT